MCAGSRPFGGPSVCEPKFHFIYFWLHIFTVTLILDTFFISFFNVPTYTVFKLIGKKSMKNVLTGSKSSLKVEK